MRLLLKLRMKEEEKLTVEGLLSHVTSLINEIKTGGACKGDVKKGC